MTERFTRRLQSSSGRPLRPTAKMLPLMDRAAANDDRYPPEDDRYSPQTSQRSGSLDMNALRRMEAELEEEIRHTELNISQKEEELRRSCASPKRQSPQITSTPDNVSTSVENDVNRYLKVVDSTGPDEPTGTWAQSTPAAPKQCDQVMTYRRDQITFPENRSLKEHHRGDEAVSMNKAAPEFYPQQTEMWYAAQKAPPPR